MRVAAALEIDAFRLLRTSTPSARETTFQVLLQHASEISDADWHLLREIEARLTKSLQAAARS
jgi:hypothetical protein